MAEEQRLRSEQFGLARRIEKPFAPFLRAHHLAIALGDRQHAHDDIFGDGDRVDPGAVGDDDTAIREQVERHAVDPGRSEEHTSELQSLMRISYAVFCLKKKQKTKRYNRQSKTTKCIR